LERRNILNKNWLKVFSHFFIYSSLRVEYFYFFNPLIVIFGETAIRRNGRFGGMDSMKCTFGETNFRQNVSLANHPFGETASVKWISAKWTSAKSPDTSIN
jgi:hypothetical protein